MQDLSNTTYAGRLDYSRPLADASKIELGWKGTYFFINNDVINTVLDNGNWIQDIATSNRFQYTQHIEALYAIYSGKYKQFEYQAGLRGEYTFINANQVTLNEKNDQRYFDLLRNANPQLTSEYGDLKIFYSDFPDNRKILLSLSYRFGN